MLRSRTVLLLSLLVGSSCATTARRAQPPLPQTRVDAGRTHWVLEPHEAFDALCLLNILRADAFYLRFTQKVYDRWAPLLSDKEKQALRNLTAQMVEKGKDLPSAKLTLVFSGSTARTTQELLDVVNDDARWAAMRKVHLARPDTETTEFDDVDAVRGDLRELLGFLLRVDFPAHWRREEVPKIQKAIAEMVPTLQQADVVSWDEEVIGHSMGVEAVYLDVLAYVRPHGIRVNGWRFLSDALFPVDVTEKTALHELLHPPYQRKGELAATLTRFEQDPYFQRLLKEHNPSFGYVDAHGFTEEDCAEAIDVFNSEKHGLLTGMDGKPTDGATFFSEHDDGMHVPAFLIYRELTRADFGHWPGYTPFLLDFFAHTPSLEARFRADPKHYEVKALRGLPPR